VILTDPTKICRIGMSFVPATGYLLIYTTLVSAFISASAVWPYLRQGQLVLIDYPRLATNTGLSPQQHYRRRRAAKKQAIVDAGLNIATSLIAICVLFAFLIAPDGVTWFNIISAAALDLALATLVTTATTWVERDKAPADTVDTAAGDLCFVCASCASNARMENSMLNWFSAL